LCFPFPFLPFFLVWKEEFREFPGILRNSFLFPGNFVFFDATKRKRKGKEKRGK
jgi:hypothetical protein